MYAYAAVVREPDTCACQIECIVQCVVFQHLWIEKLGKISKGEGP